MSTQRVLVVDDEPKIRMTVRGYLEADGIHVIEAADGPAALQSVTRDGPDLVVLDVMLPGLDGFQVLRRIREASQIPVIMLTARDEEVDRLIGFTTGSDDYVTKPFSPANWHYGCAPSCGAPTAAPRRPTRTTYCASTD